MIDLFPEERKEEIRKVLGEKLNAFSSDDFVPFFTEEMKFPVWKNPGFFQYFVGKTEHYWLITEATLENKGWLPVRTDK